MCAKNDRPNGVVFTFQVCGNKIEPTVPNRRRNLLAKDNIRAALADEVEPHGPEVPVIFDALLISGGAERLAGARACPNRSVVGPSGEPQGAALPSDTGEEMALCVGIEVVWPDIGNTPCVNVSWGDMPGGNQVTQPLGGERVNLVVVGPQGISSVGSTGTIL